MRDATTARAVLRIAATLAALAWLAPAGFT